MKSALGKLRFFSNFTWVFIFLGLNCSTGKNIKVQKILVKPPDVVSFAAILSLKGDTNKGKIKLDLELFYKRPDRLIFHPRSSWGGGFFKARLSQDSITLYFPQEQEYYRDELEVFLKKLNWGWEMKLQELLTVIVNKKIDSLARAEIRYKKFKAYEQYELPYEIEIRFKDSGKKIKISFQEQKRNPALDDKMFELKIPKDAKRVDLVEN